MHAHLSMSDLARSALAGTALLLIAQTAEAGASDYDLSPGKAGAFTLKVEPGAALPLTHPQSQMFKTGGGETLKALWALNEYAGVGPSVTFLTLPAKASGSEAGTAWAVGGSVRLGRKRTAPEKFLAISPWVDADALYVRTGDLNRMGFAAAAGVLVPIGRARVFWIGPFARYFQIIQSERQFFDSADAKILSMGISLEVGLEGEREREVMADAPSRIIRETVAYCPDHDGDGVTDNVDRCPDVAGPLDNWGCPPYKRIILRRDKLELTEKLYFAWNEAVLQEVSFPVLDEVVQALTDNKTSRVQVEGHASSEGTDDRNQTLSEQRADAVLNYLVAHGIDRGRLASKGFGSSIPLDTNRTITGRENNRRVEFVVFFNILDEGSK